MAHSDPSTCKLLTEEELFLAAGKRLSPNGQGILDQYIISQNRAKSEQKPLEQSTSSPLLQKKIRAKL